MQLAPTWCGRRDSNPHTVKAMEPKSIESTNSTTPACCRIDRHYQYISKFLFRQSLPEEKKGDIMAY